MKSYEELLKDNIKLRIVIQYAINRLTDNDLYQTPYDLRHIWVNEASRIMKETEGRGER